ncbi:hypothetical protein L9F63_016102, partial [Diploptera punctata]
DLPLAKKLFASMDLPPDKAKLLKQYDDEKKWDIICDQLIMHYQSYRTEQFNTMIVIIIIIIIILFCLVYKISYPFRIFVRHSHFFLTVFRRFINSETPPLFEFMPATIFLVAS